MCYPAGLKAGTGNRERHIVDVAALEVDDHVALRCALA
jgi:hypothetical protein